MSNYSYTEIQDMQRKAMERVREMKRNSDIVTQSAQREFNHESNNKPFSEALHLIHVKIGNGVLTANALLTWFK